MAGIEDFEELTFNQGINPNTGKPKGKAGRPSNQWREFQEFQAWKKLRSIGLNLGDFNRPSTEKEGSQESDNGFLGGLAQGIDKVLSNPLFGTILGKPTGVITLILGWWIAEETITDMPQILHGIMKLFDLTGSFLTNGIDGFTEKVFNDLIIEIQNHPSLEFQVTFQQQQIRNGEAIFGDVIHIDSFNFWINKIPHALVANKQLNELVDEWFKPSGLAIPSKKVFKKLEAVMSDTLMPISADIVAKFDEMFAISKYSNPLGVRKMTILTERDITPDELLRLAEIERIKQLRQNCLDAGGSWIDQEERCVPKGAGE